MGSLTFALSFIPLVPSHVSGHKWECIFVETSHNEIFQKPLQLDVCTDTKVSFMHILQAKELILRIC